MKEFDKWDKGAGCKVECYTDCLQCKGSEAAWRAALKWALDLWWHKSNDPELFRELLEDELELDK